MLDDELKGLQEGRKRKRLNRDVMEEIKELQERMKEFENF